LCKLQENKFKPTAVEMFDGMQKNATNNQLDLIVNNNNMID